jgi:hypothetical protein
MAHCSVVTVYEYICIGHLEHAYWRTFVAILPYKVAYILFARPGHVGYIFVAFLCIVDATAVMSLNGVPCHAVPCRVPSKQLYRKKTFLVASKRISIHGKYRIFVSRSRSRSRSRQVIFVDDP